MRLHHATIGSASDFGRIFGDKAFLASLIIIRLADYRRVAAQRCSLMQLAVIEEGRWPTPHQPQFGADGRPDGSSSGNL
jgi:hypothetical protein